MQPPGRTRSIGRAACLVALVFVASVALHGYVPGLETAPREPAATSSWPTVVVVGLLVVAVGIVAAAVLARVRSGVKPAPHPAGRPDWSRREGGRPGWRIWLVAFAVLLVWLVVAALLGRLGGDGPPPIAGSGSTAESGGGSAAAQPGTGGADATAPPDPGTDGSLLAYFYAASVVFLIVVIVGSVAASRRQRRPLPQPVLERGDDVDVPDTESDSESLVRAAEVGLAEVGDLSREPRKAIIACYAAMERELALLPHAAPRDFDTASEVLARAVDHRALRPDSATGLVDLFDEARFSPHVMNEGHRDAAVTVLTRVLGELRSHA